ncbi:PAS domain S-box protein [Natrialbaceae archaeon AArc-T1-2]|uniref:PAS domain S-box protein n=1 Tax=Natrialbaceae archaeon AArc-T1-2 TaxID=3053904 RepID=UPI00255AA569|nr:PAS domain S-box protein [Natrialbaceae archaeon AArc-T1-2]WIV66521.1 PAS domain S-box protein [Natrialbaceae archaeon AArc-T1-2]
MESGSLTAALEETLAVFDGSGEPRTTPEVADRLELGRRSTYDRLERLAERNRLETKKVGANARIWWRPSESAGRSTDAASLVDDVLDDVDVGIFVLDEQLDVAWTNAATERYFGLDREQVLGRDKRRLVDEHIATVFESPTAFTETVLATYDDNTYTERFECHVTAGDEREERWLEYRSKPIDSGEYAGGRIELYYDVTDRKRSDRTREKHRETFTSLVGTLEEYAIFTLDSEGHVQTWSPGAERINGYESDDVCGEHVSTFYTDDDREAGVPERNLDAAAEHGSIQEEGWRVREDGSRFWADVTITAIHDEAGNLRGYATITRDTTERQQRERQLRRERDLTERLLETVPARLAVFRPDGSVERISSRTRQQLGIDESAVSEFGVEDFDIYDPDGTPIPVSEHPVPHVIETGETVSDWLVQHDGPDGDRRWVSLTVAPLFDDDGDVERVVVAGKDVTALTRTQRRLERQRDELRAELEEVFDRIDDAVYGLDEDWQFTYLNDRAVAILGETRAELLGTAVWEVFDRSFEDHYERAMRTQESVVFEAYSDAAGAWLEVTAYPSESGLSVYFRDVSDRKERERRLSSLIDNVPGMVYRCRNERGWPMEFVSDACNELTGYDPETLERGDVEWGEDVMLQRDRETLWKAVQQRGDCGSTFSETYRIETADGERRWVRDYGRGVFEAGELVSVEGVIEDVTDRIERERKLEHQREQLAALDSLNQVVSEITDAVIGQSTREEIEETVCTHLAESDSYLFAWIGDVDAATQTVNLRTEAGVEGYLDGITISVDPDDERSKGPTGRAFRTGEMQTTHDVDAESRHDPWRDHIEPYGFRSSAAIPISHDGALYGTLNVYAERLRAFEGREGELIGQLGQVVGHAIAAAERKRALMSDELVELKFRIQDIFEAFGVPGETDGRITIEHAVPVGDDEFLVYGTATPDAVDTLDGLVETRSHWESVTVTVRSEGDPASFELRLTDPPVLSLVASLGGYIERAVFEDGDYQMTIHLAPSADVRRIIDAVETTYPQAEMLRRQQISRPRDASQHATRRLASGLTDRQRTTLDVAYHAGFFEWPRETSGEEVAESLGVAPSTFHQHLRKAEQKVFDSLFSTATLEEPRTT